MWQDEPGKPTALRFGPCKLNVHQVDHTFEPKAHVPTPGSADFCLSTNEPLDVLLGHLRAEGVAAEEGRWSATARKARCCPSTFATRTETSLK